MVEHDVILFYAAQMFLLSHFSFLVFGHFWWWSYENTKILQGKMSKMEKNQKENHTTKVTKISETKKRKFGMNETKMVTK